ncbi:hypothetical protein DFJ74DRAFT_650390 [Hyaloraphidium curvatum]|nr:hypothetical protein DFJ74DRAFT_650390 [Hyaloraphidium curvatum]
MTRDLAGLGEQVTYQEQPPQPAVDEEKEALKERVVRLAEIVEARTREVQDELLGREDRIRELELVAQQAHATSRRTVRTLQDLQRENRDLRAQASELDLAREQLRRARDEAEMLRGDMKEAQRVSGMLARDVEERTRVARELEDRLGQEMQTRRRILKDLDDAISERAELRQRLADKEIQLSRLSRAFDDQARESEQQVRDLNNLVREMQRRIRDVGRTLEDQAAYATPPRSRIPSGAESPAVPSARRIEYGERSSTPETPSPARSTPRRFTYEPQQQQPERDDRAPVSTPRPRYREYAAPPQREERSAWESGAFDYVRGGQRGPYYEPQVDTGSRGQQAQAPGGRPSSGRYEGPGRAPMPSPLRRLSEEEGYAGLGPQEVSREAKLSGGSVRTRTD